MRTTMTGIVVLGLISAASALAVPTSALAQGVYFGGPGFAFEFGAPYYGHRYYRYYDEPYGYYGYYPYRHWRHRHWYRD